MNQALKEIQCEVELRTTGLDTEDYIEFMEELANWAHNQAALADYTSAMGFHSQD